MLICHCQAVNDRTVKATILAGARHVDEIADRCGAASQCGGCISAVLELLAEFEAHNPATARTSAA